MIIEMTKDKDGVYKPVKFMKRDKVTKKIKSSPKPYTPDGKINDFLFGLNEGVEILSRLTSVIRGVK